jgi:hypothetical protein
MDHRLGSWAFILGVLIALLGGAFAGWVVAYAGVITLVLVILGLIVGFLNIGHKEMNDFLIAAIALALVGLGANAVQLSTIPWIGGVVAAMVANVVVFVAAAALIVALKAVANLARAPA